MKWGVICFFCLITLDLYSQHKVDSALKTLDNATSIHELNTQLYNITSHDFLKELNPDRSTWDSLLNDIAENIIQYTEDFSLDFKTIVLAHMAEVLVREKTDGLGHAYIKEALR